MDSNEVDRGIDLTQLWGVLFLRWRIIAAVFGAALSILLITEIIGDGLGDQGQSPVVAQNTLAAPRTFTAYATYAVAPISSEVAVASDEAARLAQALVQTYRYLLSTSPVREALVSDLSAGITAQQISYSTQILVQGGTPLITVTGTMDLAADAIAVVNGYAEALQATDSYSSILLPGDLWVELVLINPALMASANELDEIEVINESRSVPSPLVFGSFGLFLGVVMALFVEWMDGRANWPAQVTSRIGLSSIGSLREHRDGSFDMESFRAAKARINGILPRGPYGRSLLVTSAHAKDGKTMVVSNLASSLAEDGSSVMIVSADVRSDTSIDGAWPGIDDRIGLSEYLNDDSIQLDDVIASTPESGISIVTRGRMPESIVPRIDSRRMGDLLDGLRERFDWIVLDGSAVLESADAARVSPLVDGTLLVIDGRRTTLSAAQSSADTLIGAGAGLIGFFHNRTRGNPMARMLRQEIG